MPLSLSISFGTFLKRGFIDIWQQCNPIPVQQWKKATLTELYKKGWGVGGYNISERTVCPCGGEATKESKPEKECVRICVYAVHKRPCARVCAYCLWHCARTVVSLSLCWGVISCVQMGTCGKPLAPQTFILYCLRTIACLRSFQIQIPKAFLSIMLTKHWLQLRDIESPQGLKELWRWQETLPLQFRIYTCTWNHTSLYTCKLILLFCFLEWIAPWGSASAVIH